MCDSSNPNPSHHVYGRVPHCYLGHPSPHLIPRGARLKQRGILPLPLLTWVSFGLVLEEVDSSHVRVFLAGLLAPLPARELYNYLGSGEVQETQFDARFSLTLERCLHIRHRAFESFFPSLLTVTHPSGTNIVRDFGYLL